MRIPLSLRLKALFSIDKEKFWWNHYTNEERVLSEMDAKQLSSALSEAQMQNNREREILVEHILSARLARLQSNASWGSGTLGFVGAIIGAALGAAMTASLSPNSDSRTIVRCEYSAPSAAPASQSAEKTNMHGLTKVPSATAGTAR